MPDYSKGKIYKLWSIDNDLIYVGSTTQTLSKRLSQHKSHRYRDCTSSILFEKSNNVKIELLESYPCNSKEELDKREGEMIRKLDCVNKFIAGRTEKEYREDNREKINEYKKEYYQENKGKKKEYYEKNKGKFCDMAKERYQNNKEKIVVQRKEHYEKNKEKIAVQRKEHYEKNKEKLYEKKAEKVHCDVCNCYITKQHFKRHERSMKHISKINN